MMENEDLSIVFIQIHMEDRMKEWCSARRAGVSDCS